MKREHPDAFDETHDKPNGHGGGNLIQSSAQFVQGFVPPDYLIDGILQRRRFYSFTGKTGSGKTAIALLLAAHVPLGRPIGNREVAQGRVLYLAGENSDDVRMRWIAMAQKMEFDADTINVCFIPDRFKISALYGRILQEIQQGGEVAFVVVDTTAAYFEGDNANDNVQQIVHAQRLRTLTALPGGPCVLAPAHPTKNATRDNLIPYGGGGFINETDGNLTCWNSDSIVEVHWQGKFRGPDFAPLTFETRTVTHDKLKDTKGRLLPTVIAAPLSEADQQERVTIARTHQDQLLTLLERNGNASHPDLAKRLGWFMSNGDPYKMLVRRTLKALADDKLITPDRGGYKLTDKGKKALTADGKTDDQANTQKAEDTRKAPKIKIDRTGSAPDGSVCLMCREAEGEVAYYKNAARIGSKPETLHWHCGRAWFEANL
jgi:hypothetical protein